MYWADVTTPLLRIYTYHTYTSVWLSLPAFSSLGMEWCDRAGPLWQQLEEVLTGRVREAVRGRRCQVREERREVRADSQRPVSDLMGSGRRWREGAKFSPKAWSQSEVSWNWEYVTRTTPGILSREYLVWTVHHKVTLCTASLELL